MWLLAGLGNPGPRYAHTRHNAGFMAVDEIAQNHRFPDFSKKFKSLISSGELSGESLLLLKPQTFMNLSGEAVGEAMRFYKLAASQVIVIHDDVDLPVGEVRLKRGGGTGGHNGLKSLEEHIGADSLRIRIGIGKPEGPIDVSDYVLHPFAPGEILSVTKALLHVRDNIVSMLSQFKNETFANKKSLAGAP